MSIEFLCEFWPHQKMATPKLKTAFTLGMPIDMHVELKPVCDLKMKYLVNYREIKKKRRLRL